MDTQKSENPGREEGGIDNGPAAETDENILRSKTFNRELKSLVKRIVSNEEKTEEENIDDLTENQLLYRLHKIFYRIKSLDEIESAYTSFNPFIIDADNDLAKGIAGYLKTAFNSLGISVYDVLAFNINDRCFSSTYSELKPGSKTDIIINLKDTLFKKILEKEGGYLLTTEEINGDSFLSKKFSGLDDEEDGEMLLFTRLSSITVNLIKELNRGHRVVPLVEYLSPVIIFRLEEQSSGDIQNRIEVLRNELSIPLYLSLGGLIPSLELHRYDDLDSLAGIVETLLTLSIISEDLNGILIKICRACGKEMLYEIKYLIARLTNSLDEDASIIRIKSDIILILTHKNNTGTVREVIAEYNRIHDNIFDIEIIGREKKDEIPGILSKICF